MTKTVRLVISSEKGRASEAVLRPAPDGSVGVALNGRAAAGLTARSKLRENAVNIELAIPWSALFAAARPGAILGFDLFWTDVDKEDGETVAGTLRWAGGAARTGFLLLKAQTQ